MAEMKSLTLNGKTYDSFVDKEAREALENAVRIPGGSNGGTADINIRKWFGKKIVVDGSSITNGGTGNAQPTWFSFIKDMFALDAVYNHAVNGTGWFVGGTTALQRVDDYEADADAVIMMGDYNGIYTGGLGGTIEDEAAEDGSCYARLKFLAEKLINKYPLCPVIWVIEPPRASVGEMDSGTIPMNHNSGYHAYSKKIEEVAELYGFPHCNLMKNTVFRPWIQANYDETTSDGTHPWNNVQRTMAQVIAETMKRTPLFYNESYVVTPDNSGGNTGEDSGAGEDTTDKTITKITATPITGYSLFENDTSANVKQAIKVKVYYDDLSEQIITNYDVTGEFAAGNQTFTITYEGFTTTVVLAVTAGERTVSVRLDETEYTADVYPSGGGNFGTSVGSAVSDYIAVKPGSIIHLSWVNNGRPAMYYYYDEIMQYAGQQKGTYGTYDYQLPDTAYYVRVTGPYGDSGTQIITYVPR